MSEWTSRGQSAHMEMNGLRNEAAGIRLHLSISTRGSRVTSVDFPLAEYIASHGMPGLRSGLASACQRPRPAW